MADEEHLRILLEEGVEAWNAWRLKNPEIKPELNEADLVDAKLKGANFKDGNFHLTHFINADLSNADFGNAYIGVANFTEADLSGANLKKAMAVMAKLFSASLEGADLRGTNLPEANLRGANLTGADFSSADLIKADLSDAVTKNTKFAGAIVSSKTKGLAKLSDEQRRGLIDVDRKDETEDQPEKPEGISVRSAKRIVTPACWALKALTIPDSLSEEHRKLFLELLQDIEDLERKLAETDDDQRLSTEIDEIGVNLEQRLTLWQRAWEEFVLSAATSAGDMAVKGAIAAAGYVAGGLMMRLNR